MNTTCQICGRAIKAQRGWIAHHGYTRPGQGWQTASCFGAGYRPYEVACDALPKAIENARAWGEGQKAHLANLTETPPAILMVRARGSHYSAVPKLIEVKRPDDFDKACRYSASPYANAYRARVSELNRNIKEAEMAVAEYTTRLQAWKAVA